MTKIPHVKFDWHEDEAAFRKNHPILWYGTLLCPVVLTTVLLTGVFIFAGWAFATRLVANTMMALWLLGRFIILSGADDGLNDFHGSLSSLQLFLLVTYLDSMVAAILAFHIGWLFRVPVIGPRVQLLATDGEFFLQSQPWMKRATFAGLVAFVGFPLAATGSVGGSIFGRMLGMGRLQTFAGIVLGSVIGNGMMFYFSDLLGHWLDKDHPAVHYGGLAVIVALVIFLERRYQSLKRSRLGNQRKQGTTPPVVAEKKQRVQIVPRASSGN